MFEEAAELFVSLLPAFSLNNLSAIRAAVFGKLVARE
jgi:hypothetical protein